jgi:hypothetical protein
VNRRRIALWMLWLGLIGFGPFAFACLSSASAHDDCCPTGQHVHCQGQPDSVASTGHPSCCLAQPALSRAVVGSTPNRRLLALYVPPPAVLLGSWASDPRALQPDPFIPIESSRLRSDGARTYLQTRRLRL